MLIEFKNLLCKAVTAQHELVALGNLQVGHAAKAVADGAVDPGTGVCLEVGPQFVLLLLALPSSRRKMSLMAIIMER